MPGRTAPGSRSSARMSAIVWRSGRGLSPAASAAAGLALLMFAPSASPSAHSGRAAPSTPCSSRNSLPTHVSSRARRRYLGRDRLEHLAEAERGRRAHCVERPGDRPLQQGDDERGLVARVDELDRVVRRARRQHRASPGQPVNPPGEPVAVVVRPDHVRRPDDRGVRSEQLGAHLLAGHFQAAVVLVGDLRRFGVVEVGQWRALVVVRRHRRTVGRNAGDEDVRAALPAQRRRQRAHLAREIRAHVDRRVPAAVGEADMSSSRSPMRWVACGNRSVPVLPR